MIERSIAEEFLTHDVRVTTISNFHFKGLLKTVSDDGILIDDIKDGFKFISFIDIKNLEVWKNESNMQ